MSTTFSSAAVKTDLHSHSTFSDGTYTPTQLLNLAKEAGIKVFALTDHDTLTGIAEAQTAAKCHDIQLISGVEISCEHILTGGYGKNKAKQKVIHVLGLGFTDFTQMNATLSKIQTSRANRGYAIVEKLAKITQLPVAELWASVLTKAEGNAKAVGRAHIAKVLYERGIVKTMQQAFDKYLADNKPAYVAIESLSMADTIELIHACGGKAVLAHPTRYQLSATRVRKLIADFAQMGGDACELPSADEPISTRKMVDRSVAEHGLAVSTGSDFHGTTMPWRRLGDVPKLAESQRLITLSL
ncbi:PHP domain-containing protein [Psychrobacter sp. I-STPA10]|uniref:PHP domain-containing protein n=1 Tax=Psychrobacter sp. I-STPA10 TaxID=2585769 RepID=UPI001E2BECF0|nr:PHP domain-containing protein [Psychrobacter sp. I-STPA10]